MTSSLWAGTAVDGFTGYDGMDEGGGGVGYDGVNEGGGGAGEAEQHAPEGVNMEQDSHASLGPASSLRISTELGRQVRDSLTLTKPSSGLLVVHGVLIATACPCAGGQRPHPVAAARRRQHGRRRGAICQRQQPPRRVLGRGLPLEVPGGPCWGWRGHQQACSWRQVRAFLGRRWPWRCPSRGPFAAASLVQPSCRRKKAAVVIDFENLDPLPPGAFDLAPNAAISLKSRAAVNTLLPPDLHYQVGFTYSAAQGWAHLRPPQRLCCPPVCMTH